MNTVEECAGIFGVTVDELLKRLRVAGLYKGPKSAITPKEVGAWCEHERRKKTAGYAQTADEIELAYCRALVREARYKTCAACGEKVNAKNLGKHMRRHAAAKKKKRDELVDEPLGVIVNRELGRTRYYSYATERCSSCRARVVHLDIGKNVTKAFDVDIDSTIRGTHACDCEAGTARSIRAVSGGIVESNRRRH